MIDFLQYPFNFWIWLRRFYTLDEWFDADGVQLTLRKRALFYGYWILDVLPNTITGGDPEESLSSRFHKDRHAWLPGVIINIVEGFTTQDHGVRSMRPYVGDGSENNRELTNIGQIVVTLGWVAAGIWTYL